VLKVKVGLDVDETTIASIRAATDKPLAVDANEGWTDKEVAVRKINWLATKGVEFVEQPMPAHMLEEIHWVHQRSQNLPPHCDEAVLHPSDIPKLAGAFDGVNVSSISAVDSRSLPRIQMRNRSDENHAGLA